MLNEIKKDAQTRMAKSTDALKHELSTLRTGRASTGLVDNLKVNYYGSDMPLNQVATVTVSDARSITITPWEKAMVGPVEKAILASNLGFTPNTLGQIIRINLPPLTEERRSRKRQDFRTQHPQGCHFRREGPAQGKNRLRRRGAPLGRRNPENHR